MSTVPFWTPLNTKDRFTSMVDGCFSFGSEEAIVSADGKTAILSPKLYEETKWATAKRIIILMTGILPLIALFAKCVIRMTSKIECIDLTSTLSHGVKASQQSLDMIRSHMAELSHMADLIYFNTKIKGITLIKDHCSNEYRNIAFELESAPEQIFEMRFTGAGSSRESEINKIYSHSYRTQIICHQENLKLVALRGISKETIQFKKQSYSILVKQKLPDEHLRLTNQSEFYFSKKNQCEETVREHTRFIMAAGFSGAYTSYIHGENPPKVLLLEPYFSDGRNIEEELYDFAASLPENLCEIAVETAQEKGISLDQARIYRHRKTTFNRLTYYEKNGIFESPQKPIDILLKQLNLPSVSLTGKKLSGEPLEPVTFECVATAIIEQINASIAKQAPLSARSLSDRRSVSVPLTHFWEDSRMDLIHEGIKQWHPQILKALKQCGAIFDYQLRAEPIIQA